MYKPSVAVPVELPPRYRLYEPVASWGEEKTIDWNVFVGLKVKITSPEAFWRLINLGVCGELRFTSTEF